MKLFFPGLPWQEASAGHHQHHRGEGQRGEDSRNGSSGYDPDSGVLCLGLPLSGKVHGNNRVCIHKTSYELLMNFL
jgi:hypothetical protein